jgi:hypothetical protein
LGLLNESSPATKHVLKQSNALCAHHLSGRVINKRIRTVAQQTSGTKVDLIDLLASH